MSLPALSDYVDLVTSEHRDKPKFVAMLSLYAQWAIDLRTLLRDMPTLFDVDVAVGEQLDFVAAWVGARRRVTISPTATYPLPANPYVYTLTDDELRLFCKGRIMANFWDGTAEALVPIFVEFMGPGRYGAELDDLDMTITLYMTGVTPAPWMIAVVEQDLMPVRAAGVKLKGIWTTDGGPLFGLDVQNNFIAGPDYGHFGTFNPGP